MEEKITLLQEFENFHKGNYPYLKGIHDFDTLLKEYTKTFNKELNGDDVETLRTSFMKKSQPRAYSFNVLEIYKPDCEDLMSVPTSEMSSHLQRSSANAFIEDGIEHIIELKTMLSQWIADNLKILTLGYINDNCKRKSYNKVYKYEDVCKDDANKDICLYEVFMGKHVKVVDEYKSLDNHYITNILQSYYIRTLYPERVYGDSVCVYTMINDVVKDVSNYFKSPLKIKYIKINEKIDDEQTIIEQCLYEMVNNSLKTPGEWKKKIKEIEGSDMTENSKTKKLYRYNRLYDYFAEKYSTTDKAKFFDDYYNNMKLEKFNGINYSKSHFSINNSTNHIGMRKAYLDLCPLWKCSKTYDTYIKINDVYFAITGINDTPTDKDSFECYRLHFKTYDIYTTLHNSIIRYQKKGIGLEDFVYGDNVDFRYDGDRKRYYADLCMYADDGYHKEQLNLDRNYNVVGMDINVKHMYMVTSAEFDGSDSDVYLNIYAELLKDTKLKRLLQQKRIKDDNVHTMCDVWQDLSKYHCFGLNEMDSLYTRWIAGEKGVKDCDSIKDDVYFYYYDTDSKQFNQWCPDKLPSSFKLDRKIEKRIMKGLEDIAKRLGAIEEQLEKLGEIRLKEMVKSKKTYVEENMAMRIGIVSYWKIKQAYNRYRHAYDSEEHIDGWNDVLYTKNHKNVTKGDKWLEEHPYEQTEEGSKIVKKLKNVENDIVSNSKGIIRYAYRVLEHCGYDIVAMENLENSNFDKNSIAHYNALKYGQDYGYKGKTRDCIEKHKNFGNIQNANYDFYYDEDGVCQDIKFTQMGWYKFFKAGFYNMTIKHTHFASVKDVMAVMSNYNNMKVVFVPPMYSSIMDASKESELTILYKISSKGKIVFPKKSDTRIGQEYHINGLNADINGALSLKTYVTNLDLRKNFLDLVDFNYWKSIYGFNGFNQPVAISKVSNIKTFKDRISKFVNFKSLEEYKAEKINRKSDIIACNS